jgi:glycosyltransferase involved in cell wall biosynthesis
MRTLFIHQNIPGQFTHQIAALCADPQHEVWAIGEEAALARCARSHPRLKLLGYKLGADEGKPSAHPYLIDVDQQVRCGRIVAKALLQMKSRGAVPDLIVAHPGWGESLFVKDVFPHVPLLQYFEFFFSAEAADVGFDPESPTTLDGLCRLRMRNAAYLSALQASDAGVSPTQWQRSRFPPEYRDRIAVVHDGVDTAAVHPDPAAVFEWQGQRFVAGEPIVTFVARNLEPYRGFHVFMRCLPELLSRNPKARVVIVGGDSVSYGRKHPSGRSWRRVLLDELGDRLDTSRVCFTGKLPYAQYLKLLQVSAAHVYLTYPFVLSWSMLEAMAAGALLIASRTAPVEEVLVDGANGCLVDFFDPAALVERVTQALAQPKRFAPLRQAARETVVTRYDLRAVCLPASLELLRSVAGWRTGATGSPA